MASPSWWMMLKSRQSIVDAEVAMDAAAAEESRHDGRRMMWWLLHQLPIVIAVEDSSVQVTALAVVSPSDS